MIYEYGKNAEIVHQDKHTITVNVEGGQWIISTASIYAPECKAAHFYPDGKGLAFTKVRIVEMTQNGFITPEE